MKNLDVTLGAIRVHGLTAVLLQARGKHPRSWCATCDGWTSLCHHYPGTRRVTQDLDEVRRHAGRAKVGVLGGPRLTILDVDHPALFDAMCAALGPLEPTATSGGLDADGRERFHVWLAGTPGLPRAVRWQDAIVGEVIGDGFYATVPPAVHHKTGRRSRWLRDPRGPLPNLPNRWLEHLAAQVVIPVPMGFPITHGSAGDPWSGPSADEILRRALGQPGARLRSDGSVKFQCAGCRAEGHDRDMDNARVWPTGRWGCALDRGHLPAIGVQLGVGAPMDRDDHDDAPMDLDDHDDAPMDDGGDE